MPGHAKCRPTARACNSASSLGGGPGMQELATTRAPRARLRVKWKWRARKGSIASRRLFQGLDFLRHRESGTKLHLELAQKLRDDSGDVWQRHVKPLRGLWDGVVHRYPGCAARPWAPLYNGFAVLVSNRSSCSMSYVLPNVARIVRRRAPCSAPRTLFGAAHLARRRCMGKCRSDMPKA